MINMEANACGRGGFHYGDWLALDGNVDGGVYGATDPFLISSGYYYYSTCIVAKRQKSSAKRKMRHITRNWQSKSMMHL